MKKKKGFAELLHPDTVREFNFTTNILFNINGINIENLIPKGRTDYIEALKLQAQLFREYGVDYLQGNKWPKFTDRSNQQIEIEIYKIDGRKFKKTGTAKITTIDQLRRFIHRKKK